MFLHYQKTLLHILLLFVFKTVESLHCIPKEAIFNDVQDCMFLLAKLKNNNLGILQTRDLSFNLYTVKDV